VRKALKRHELTYAVWFGIVLQLNVVYCPPAGYTPESYANSVSKCVSIYKITYNVKVLLPYDVVSRLFNCDVHTNLLDRNVTTLPVRISK
jgi:hypothetical protein